MKIKWTEEELQEISEAQDFNIGPANEGESRDSIIRICSVVVNGAVYICGIKGRRSHWYQTAAIRGSGRILVAGLTRDVIFEVIDKTSVIEQIDEKFEEKYQGHEYLKWLLSESARSGTLKVIPQKMVCT